MSEIENLLNNREFWRNKAVTYSQIIERIRVALESGATPEQIVAAVTKAVTIEGNRK